jgi:hypothetical protein
LVTATGAIFFAPYGLFSLSAALLDAFVNTGAHDPEDGCNIIMLIASVKIAPVGVWTIELE